MRKQACRADVAQHSAETMDMKDKLIDRREDTASAGYGSTHHLEKLELKDATKLKWDVNVINIMIESVELLPS
ncbi:uncharacterized protein ARMOST_13496 [Armillaria ostoyae]|uniref:Uncharacterized protein n=1 Tax=Armillaria ostoyae TaxID=47428 RepID=A0A284RMW1_ARMOS|nr:uncharacterized protein ARMOST_13496 [Armillaria ostoyae]